MRPPSLQGDNLRLSWNASAACVNRQQKRYGWNRLTTIANRHQVCQSCQTCYEGSRSD